MNLFSNLPVSRSFVAALALALGSSVAMGCVSDRPSRNGVFNENQYLRKSFLVRSAESGPDGKPQQDPGWMLKASIMQVSTPNLLGGAVFGVFPGTENGGSYVRFKISQDKLEMVNLREFSAPVAAEKTRVEEVMNAWPITNVDLKYRVNLDGEKTNYYEENQELGWDVRQWVKLNFSKNDMSDVAPFPGLQDVLGQCVDMANSTVTLVPGSFKVDEKNDYFEWTTEMTFPVQLTNQACIDQYGLRGRDAFNIGKYNQTFTLKYSMVRPERLTAPPGANALDQYTPLEVGEKDPIRHKYGFFDWIAWDRDQTSGLVAARQLVIRWNTKKEFITWYFDAGFPEQYKKFYRADDPADVGSVMGHTNKLLADAGVKARLRFLNANDLNEYKDGLRKGDTPDNQPVEYGDVRYSFLRWISDPDIQDFFAGVTQFVIDPRTGEALSSSIAFNDFAIKDYYVQRIDAYLQTIGASLDINSPDAWDTNKPTATCKDGDTMPIVPAKVAANHNGTSTLYAKMQQYLQKPVGTFGNLGPVDFTAKQDDDFFRAYYALLPYYVYGDPDSNPFVIREGGQGVYGPGQVWKMVEDEAEFHQTMAKIDQGLSPYADVTGPHGLDNALGFLNRFRELTTNHKKLDRAIASMIHPYMHFDAPSAFSFEQMMARDARHCVKDADGNLHWETKEEWTQNLIDTYWSQVAWHEFGHAMGLAHNFMASIDKPNFPQYKDGQGRSHYGLYASSVMEYNAAPDRVFWKAGWAPYDQGAISWIYANDARGPGQGDSISGQSSSKDAAFVSPWKDPHGFNGKQEIQYLFCTHQHIPYTPLCRQGDSGTTPSEIIANQIDAYEWQYTWRNFRKYRKLWDNSQYAAAPANTIIDMRRFVSLWIFDWNSGELADSLRRIGIKNPNPNGSDLQYYTQLSNKFNAEASAANQMVGAFHKAVIQQASGERPYRTVYDKFYGDVTQQGIILDKLFAMQGWVGMWPTDNYDPNQAGSYIASYSGIGDDSYTTVAEDAVDSMIGGQYDVYPYFVPLAVAQFAQDTHSPSFSGRIDVRDWIGGHTFTRLPDFLDYFRDLAVQTNAMAQNPTLYAGCTTVATCTYDPRGISDNHNEFFGPDRRLWIWSYIPDRNQWVAVQKERNTASYVIVRNYTDDVIAQLDDGAHPGGAYGALLPMKFFLDSFNNFN